MTYTQELQEWCVKLSHKINEKVKEKGKINIGWFYLYSSSHHIDNLVLEHKEGQTMVTYTWHGDPRSFKIIDLAFQFTAKDVARLADKILKDENS